MFKPVESPEIPEAERRQLTVEMAAPPGHDDPLEPAARVYRVSGEGIDDIERIALDRSRFFSSSRP